MHITRGYVMKEWYLDTPVPNITGYESDTISEYAQSNFTDVLLTSFSDSVGLCNADLSECKQIQCVIQGNTADTQLMSLQRTILVPIGTLHAGDYIYFENEYWIVDGRPGNNKSYEKATLKVCQYKLRWQKDDGTIIERWANLTSASKYDVGESGNSVILLSSNNYTILIPHDEDGHTIEGKRVFIDTSNNPKKVFKITRNDDPLFLYGSHGGVLSVIADKTELNTNTDRPDLRLCDYIEEPSTPTPPQPSEPDKTTDLRATISGDLEIIIGFKRKYTVNFTDNYGNAVDWRNVNFQWNVIGDFNIKQNTSENKIELSVESDESLIGSSFLLQCLVNEMVITQIKVTIVEGW